MKDLNKLKEEAHKEFIKIPDVFSYSSEFGFDKGWDACVRVMGDTTKKSVELWVRLWQFRKDVVSFTENNTAHNLIAKEFIDYWTEPNKSKTKMRFELEKTWDTKRRLQTWIKRDKKFNPKDTVGGEKKKTVYQGNYMDHFKRQR